MDPIEELTRKIAAQETSSRRKFFAALGKIAGSAAAVVAGISLANGGIANASTLTCCDGNACPGSSCPSGTTNLYSWHCCDGVCNFSKLCHDCYNNSNGAYVCTWQGGGGAQHCPC